MVESHLKTCSKCCMTQPISKFAFRNKKKGSRNSHCKLCMLVWQRSSRGKECLKKVQARYHQTELGKEHMKRSASLYKERYPEITRARQFIADCKKRTGTFKCSVSTLKLKSILDLLPQFCVDCGIIDDITIDHIIPLSKGGDPFSKDNLTSRCRSCNSRKGDKS